MLNQHSHNYLQSLEIITFMSMMSECKHLTTTEQVFQHNYFNVTGDKSLLFLEPTSSRLSELSLSLEVLMALESWMLHIIHLHG